MATLVRDVMTPDPQTVDAKQPVQELAKRMRDSDIGAVIILDQGEVVGIATDRDIAIRVVAEGKDAASTPSSEACSSGDLATLSPDASIDDAVKIMRTKAVRRLPVIQGGKAIGIVSLGDLSLEKDPNSALADISRKPGNR